MGTIEKLEKLVNAAADEDRHEAKTERLRDPKFYTARTKRAVNSGGAL